MVATRLACQLAYWPLCRAYARSFVGQDPADRILSWLSVPQFRLTHGFWPSLQHPRHFTEKLWHRMLFDRDPLLTLACDKLRVRDYVTSKLGSDYCIPLLWSGRRPEDIPFGELPDRFVIKTNHGCGYNVLVEDKKRLNRPSVVRQLRKWLGVNFGQDTYLGIAWAYQNIEPSLLIEHYLEEGGRPPVDYKFYCFDGAVECASMHFDRFGQHRTKAVGRDFSAYDLRYDFSEWSGDYQRPANFEAMVALAEQLSAGFDFIRVDLYSVDDRIYFSELTPYPGGVSTRFLPIDTDRRLGSIWRAVR